jgi:CBS-domain-containing membrane protein
MDRTEYRSLNARSLKPGAACRQPNSYSPVRLSTPAIEVMTDFNAVSPVTIGVDASLAQATNAMISRGVRLLFVVSDENRIIGLITARDTTGERPIKLIGERGGKHSDLRVADVMTRHEDIEALPLAEVLASKVGNILRTLERLGRQHALVVETDASGDEMVRGMFSATNIGRRLGVPIQTFEVANTFAAIKAAIDAG